MMSSNMKPIRNKKSGSQNSLRQKLRRGRKSSAPPNPKLVEVCELPGETEVKKATSKNAASRRSLPTPQGTPCLKRLRLDESPHQPVSPLALSPADRSNNSTEVLVIDTSFQDDSGNLSFSSSPSVSEGYSREHSSSNSSFSQYELEESTSSNSSRNATRASSPSVVSSSSPVLEVQGRDFPDGVPIQSQQHGTRIDISGVDDLSKYLLITVEASSSSSSSYLLLLQGGTVMPVRGQAQIRSLYGTVTIHGYEITPSTKDAIPVFCPTNVSFLCLETSRGEERKELDEKVRETLMCRLSQMNLKSMTAEEVLSKMRSDSVLLHVSRSHHKPSKFITSHAAHKHLYSGGSAKKNLRKDEISICDKVGLFMDSTGTQTQNEMQCDGYIEAARKVLEAAHGGVPPKVIFVGPKNSGKSTALKYFVNRLQCRSTDSFTDVCYLECDPGQSEFTAPAILSLHVIEQPMLGPPFTHLQDPKKAYFLGDVNPANHAKNYLKMIAALYGHYQDKFSHLPLFINTMGWVEGLGLKLLQEISVITSPTHLVQLVPQNETQVPVFSVGQEDQGLDHFRISSATRQSPPPPKETLFIEARSQSDSCQASSHRELNILAAISRLLNLNLTAKRIFDICPRVVPWSCVFLHVCHAAVPLTEILNVANASIVGLCTTSEEEVQKCVVEECSEGLRILSSAPVGECHGIGIIRAIDPEEKLFYILPAVPSEVLPKVNTLLVGAPAIPECVFLQQLRGNEDVPYISQSFDTSIRGSLPIRPKTYLKRGPGSRSVKT